MRLDVGARTLGRTVADAFRARSTHDRLAPSLFVAFALLQAAHAWSRVPPPLSWADPRLSLQLLAVALGGLGVRCLRAPHPDAAALRRTAIDAATVAAALAVVALGALSMPARHAGPSVALALADATLVTLAVLAVSAARHPGGAGLRRLLPVAGGLTACAVGDVVLAGLSTASQPTRGPLGAALLVTGLASIAVGVLAAPGADDATVMPRRERVAVCVSLAPVVAAALAAAVTQVPASRVSVPVVAAVVALSALLLSRLTVALLDNLRVTRTLESQVAERTLALLTREQWFRSLVQHSSDVVMVVDPQATIRYLSPAVARLFGYDADELVGRPVTELVAATDVGRLQAALSRAIGMPGSSFVLEFPIRHRNGTRRETETVITSLVDVPDVRGLVLNTRDVTDRKQLQERLAHQAFHDSLTGLANRSLFQQRLAVALGDAEPVAVLFCDLDGFKAVNDSLGHDVGDTLLGLVSERLRRCIRPEDLVARFGGDEFAVLLRRDAGASTAHEVADRIAAALSAPFSLDGRELRVGVSIGIALSEPTGSSVDVLLRNADLAMYRAKADRHACIVVFEPAMHDALLARLQVEDDLRSALGGGQLVLHYQPTVALATGVPVGVEALMRWYRPGRGIVAPHEFIAVAEENGFIEAMGQWALFEACRQAAMWQHFGAQGTAFGVGVNISARQVRHALVDVVAAALAESGLPPAALLLEMTESVLLERTGEAVEVLHALKHLGVRLAIDDFGTGFSSLSYLSRFPVDVLKIDRGFIADAGADAQGMELARTIVQLGQSLGLATIAEGIETQAQLQALLRMGCTLGQGYLFSRPLPANGVTVLLAGGRPQVIGAEAGLATLVTGG